MFSNFSTLIIVKLIPLFSTFNFFWGGKTTIPPQVFFWDKKKRKQIWISVFFLSPDVTPEKALDTAIFPAWVVRQDDTKRCQNWRVSGQPKTQHVWSGKTRKLLKDFKIYLNIYIYTYLFIHTIHDVYMVYIHVWFYHTIFMKPFSQ